MLIAIRNTINRRRASPECTYHFYPSSTNRNELPFCNKHFDLFKQRRVVDFNPLKLLCLFIGNNTDSQSALINLDKY